MPLLEVNGLKVLFAQNNFTAVNNISFKIEPGETLGIVGESGSGKSLTGLAVMGLLPVGANIEGEILFSPFNQALNDKGLPHYLNASPMLLNSLHDKQMQKIRGRHISMIFQEPMTALNPVMLCGRQVDEVLAVHTGYSKTERYQKVIELFKETMLPFPEEIYYKYPHQLSGGQRQRVMIAMAIACNPNLLIADEPTTALDVSVQQGIIDLLQLLQKKYQLAIMFISHDLQLVSRISDNILVMKNGLVVEQGESKSVIGNPQHAYTKGLINCVPNPGARAIRLPVIDDFLNNSVPELHFENTRKRALKHAELYSGTPLLEIEQLNVYYGSSGSSLFKQKTGFKAVNNFSLKVWPGETLGLVGESGSGKSTISRTIMLLTENFSGQVLYKGRNVTHFNKLERKQFRREVQLVFQDPYASLSPHQSIGQSIAEPMEAHNLYNNSKERKLKAQELMLLTGIDPLWYGKYPFQLSGGQRQRIVIARALALEPKLLICDESVSALDVSVQAQILNLLNDLKDSLGLTYIFISHNLPVVKYMSDRIVVIRNGQFVEIGEADELYFHPKADYTRQLIDASK